ncbi:hypothetical protein ACHAXT_010027 [Thalassiosira profunda]
MSEDHYLDSYLSEILPSLGLDAETYAPYVTGYANDDDDEDSDDSLDELIELLRASSETHGEDEAVWKDFRREIVQRRKDFVSGESARKELEALEIQEATNEQLQQEIKLAQQNALEVEERKAKELAANKVENMSHDKIAMMAKYGYEDDDGGAEDDGEPGKPMTNKEHAAAVSMQNAKSQRSSQKQTKKEAQQETAKAKADKNAKKEERRKKAGKRERHR